MSQVSAAASMMQRKTKQLWRNTGKMEMTRAWREVEGSGQCENAVAMASGRSRRAASRLVVVVVVVVVVVAMAAAIAVPKTPAAAAAARHYHLQHHRQQTIQSDQTVRGPVQGQG